MDALKIKRTPLRSAFTKTHNALNDALNNSSPDINLIEQVLNQLEDKSVRLRAVDEEILNFMLNNNVAEKDYSKEFEACEEYTEKLIAIKQKAKQIFTKPIEEQQQRLQNFIDLSGERTTSRPLRLPEINLQPFDGDARLWLNFWNTFRKIHEDNVLDDHSKFVYLLQAITPKSKASQIVNSYPVSADNYPKVIQHLKERFGREDTLIQIYVRDLLQLVLTNNRASKREFNLSSLYDNLETKLRSLESLGVTEDKYASILFPLVESCLPHDVLRIWERQREKTAQGKSELNSILDFLKNEVISEERVLLARSSLGFDNTKKCNKLNNECNSVPTANDLFISDKSKDKNLVKKCEDICIFCDKCHLSEKCFKANSLSFDEKRSLILKKGACFLCLKKNHISRNCKSKIKCTNCGKKHNFILCQNVFNEEGNAAFESRKHESGSSDTVLTTQGSDPTVLLQTLNVRVKHDGKEKIVRGVIDTGSERSYLSEDVIKYLNYKSIGEINLIHKLFGGVETNETKHSKYRIHLSSMDNCYKCDMHVLGVPVICSKIKKVPNGPWLSELNKCGIKISDVENSVCKTENEIKLLIGSDVAGKLLTGNIKILKSGPVAVKTHLGWTLMGKIPGVKSETNDSLMVISSLWNDSSVADLWKLDIIGITDPVESKTKSEIHEETMQHFKNNIRRDSEGRYEVALPWVLDNARLPSNRELAEKRLATTMKKLSNLNKTEVYSEVFDSWINAGIIERVVDNKQTKVHYLPHRPVFKESSETTKVRPVFDASAHVKGSPSLNDCLDKGLNMIEMIPSILHRFRKFPIGVVSDIEKAFLQIGIKEKDRDYLRFLWEKDIIYRHKRVVFGINCSPFLLAATLKHHLESAPDNFASTAMTLNESLYVDNCVYSFNTVEELNKFIFESQMLLSSAKFNLRGWLSNYPIPIISENSTVKMTPVLGLNWDLVNDTLSCKIGPIEEEQIVPTKRALLSLAQKVFDPLGFTSPVTLLPKLILQECWKLKIKWDELMPENLAKQFLKWVQGMKLISDIKLQRWMNFDNYESNDVGLHIFCDGSKHAYATCIFLRVKTKDKILVTFIQSRARVAPLKNITVPRLELLACCIGARLGSRVISDLRIPNLKIFYWTDSTTALSWIKRDERWGTFVWNRVEEIRSLTQKDQWRHISGKFNPADLPSRGCSVEQFLQLRWWEGPAWLAEPEFTWPQSVEAPDEEVINAEKRKSVISAMNKNIKSDDWYYRRFSSYKKIVRLIAWILRFINNARKPNSKEVSELTCFELEQAERRLVILIQRDRFDEKSNQKIRSLRPILDEDGIIRVKTQVIYREDTINFKYPVLLPSDHPVVHRLISWKHQELLHAGVALLMTSLREDYWILKARKTIRAVVQKCVRCRRFSAQKTESIPIALPADRVQDAAVFQITGVDLAGPLYLKNEKKAWIVLYTCAVYRAIHLELVTSLSTDAFLQSFRRFIARRGRPTTVYSDNGRNFVGADKAFSEIDWEQISAVAASQKIHWKFNPPTAAWWGGWWERLIQMVKRILRKVLGRASLSYEELITILCDCEQVVNARPLTYVTEDVDDLAPLTPSMFLQEIRSSDVVDFDAIDAQELNKRIKYRQHVRENLRKRFRIEYLGQLRQQSSPQKNVKQLTIGDVVLIESDKKRAYWTLARVQELIVGKDGHPRVARVKTESGELLRPVQKLYNLEIPKELDNDPVVRTRSGRRVTVPIRYKL